MRAAEPAPVSDFETARGGMRAAIPVVLGYLAIGFAAGAVGAAEGLSPLEIVLLSLLLFAGSAQFVFADLYAGSPAALVSAVFLVNFRHFLYSASLSQKLRKLTPAARFAIGAQLTDETFSVASATLKAPLQRARWMIALNFVSYSAWCMGNLAGAVATGGIEFAGAEFALAAMFAALLMLQVSGNRPAPKLCAALIAAGTMIGLELTNPHPLNLLAATAVAATACLLMFGDRDVDGADGEESLTTRPDAPASGRGIPPLQRRVASLITVINHCHRGIFIPRQRNENIRDLPRQRDSRACARPFKNRLSAEIPDIAVGDSGMTVIERTLERPNHASRRWSGGTSI